MSRLKKKLFLYFILIAIVSISVSAEIILELSSSRFTDQIIQNVNMQIDKTVRGDQAKILKDSLGRDVVFKPMYNLRNRMILLLLVISGCIVGAFFMFTRDIVAPMDGMVEATKKIADGDLTVTVPVESEDEIGQVAGLINNMNTNLQDMIMQIRQEINRHMEQIIKASFKIGEIVNSDATDEIIMSRKMKVSDFKRIIQFGKDVVLILETMSEELYALQKFVNMYKTYQVQNEISQDEIELAIKQISGKSAGPGED